MRHLHRKPIIIRRNIFLTGAFLLAILSNFLDCYGAEFSIKPSITFAIRYDDNINLTQNNTVASFIPEVLPSITLSYRTPIWDLTLSDTFDWYYYMKTNSGNYSNNANLTSKLIVIKNLFYFDVTDVNSNEVLNPRGRSTETNLNVNRTNTNALDAIPYIKYQIDPATAAKTGFTYTNLWYRQDGINRQQYKGFLSLEHKFTEKLNSLLGAEYVADRPERIYPNDDQTAVFTSFVYTLDPRTKFDATAGYRWISSSPGRDYNKPIYDVGLVYQLLEKGQIQLRASQLFGVSPIDGLVETAVQQLTASYGEVLSIDGRIYHTRDFYFQIGQTNDAAGIKAGLAYTANPRTAFRISGGYEKDKYLPQDEKRDIYSASAGVDYKLTPKTTMSVIYYYNKSSGQIDTDNYTDNTVQLRLMIEI